MPEFCTCGTKLVPDSLFCHKCGKAQREILAPEFERMLVHSGLSLTKFWFSVTRSEQRTRFVIRQVDPVRQWKLSPMDIQSLDKWDDYTEAKEWNLY